MCNISIIQRVQCYQTQVVIYVLYYFLYRCFDACLVIDGSLSYKFNDGTRATIEIHDSDDLRTIQLK
jgi:hypothetical protein